MGCIYQALNIVNDKRYIGKTVYTMECRKCEHLKDAIKGSGLLFHRAIRKHGPDAFEWRVLLDDLDIDDLDVAERLVIKRYKSHGPLGYNLTDGGEGTSGLIHSVETKAKRSASLLGNKNSLGYFPNAVTRAKQRESAIRYNSRPEVKARKREQLLGNQYGLNPTESARAKMRIAATGNRNAVSNLEVTRELHRFDAVVYWKRKRKQEAGVANRGEE